ncbi:NAD(P)-dependent oxidoreductase [Rickettsiales endosymbiont of Peranema trichophorum]|uniref:NAD(P)-dependent oxidoreductase n=1 Tax=Rickettsiales endosymbiont of Peranema trichophorum TaxID=2486577 RepID=UPI00102312F2|nr:NAD(P)-dependent oxidoreductase [Rickettsiales endosymbiont of Peranema trichophorum]RZI45083.1 NAD(P)-dependent oxidoreductase [Rickettsiales endosymbiont of Peranema trichophorum]
MKVAFLGLGIMGMPMAMHLKSKGYNLTVWNRDQKKVLQLGLLPCSLEDTVENRDYVMMCLANDDSVQEVSRKILPFLKKGAVVIDHTTTSAHLAKKLYHVFQERDIHFMDAPMTGGQTGAENGTLVMMCGGDQAVFDKSKTVLSAYASVLEYFGKAGNGQLCKMVNQICIAGIIQALAEGVDFAQKSGIDAEKLFPIIANGAGGSWQMKNRHIMMLRRDFQENVGFPVEWMLKDLNLCLKEGAEIGASLELTSWLKDKYRRIKEEINSRFDASALILLLQNKLDQND